MMIFGYAGGGRGGRRATFRGTVARSRPRDAPSDAGSYICKGINGFGTSSFEFVVDVRGAAANGDPGARHVLTLAKFKSNWL